MTDDVIIFGCSPFVNEIKEDIPKLQEKYTTIGINMFPVYYPNVNHWFFYDDQGIDILKEHYKGQKIHTREALMGHLDLLNITNFECFKPTEGYIDKENENSLLFVNYTISLVVHWCIRKGFKNIYFIGIDMDSEDWFHFFEPDYARFSHHRYQKQTMKWIYDLQEYINIYQVNPSNTLKLPKKNIKDLLNARYNN
jgi:hypothetical protein